jgi:hypothetical protein
LSKFLQKIFLQFFKIKCSKLFGYC